MIQGVTIPGSCESNSIFQGQIAVKMVTASNIAVLSTVPWTVMARVSVREVAVLGSTPTKPPNDFDEKAGFDVRKAVRMAMEGSLALPSAHNHAGNIPAQAGKISRFRGR